MNTNRWIGLMNRPGWVVLFLVSLLLTGCNFGSLVASEPTATPEPEPTAIPEPTPTEEPRSTADVFAEAQEAIIQIEAQGTFASPDEGMVFNAAGSGSGFIIDESGIAVTNNHVVTGAALINVYVGGADEPRNARVLGVSECSDLAIIDIDGDGFPTLEWYEEDLRVGMDVFAAGFPLGDPEYTLTRGIISKAQTSGDTTWTSVDTVLEHDATINPGNSGGPLLNAEGQVIGVNYALNPINNQYFAIAQEEALQVINQLRDGQDVTSIGINGEAFVLENGVSGIWVSSVESGSPADTTGVQPGDIVTRLEQLVLASDGTMKDYCDILRSRNADDTLAIEVFRLETEELLEGQLNGRELEPVIISAPDVPTTDPQAQEESTEFYTLTHDSGVLSMDIPTAWGDTASSTWTIMGQEAVEGGIALRAAPDWRASRDWQAPSALLAASRPLAQQMSPDALLDRYNFGDSCTYDGREDLDSERYIGKIDSWSNCGNTNTGAVVMAFMPEDSSLLGVLAIRLTSEADLEAFLQIFATFAVNL